MQKNICFYAVAALFTLTACTNSPFGKFASKQQECFDIAIEMMEKLNNMELYSKEALEFKNNMDEKMETLREEVNEAAKASIGTEVDTEATTETGITLDGNFRIADVISESDPKFILKVKAKVADPIHLRNVYVFGYDGNTPLLSFGFCPDYDLDGEKNILLFALNCGSDDPDFPKLLGRVTKIILSTDEALYDQLKQEMRERKMDFMKKHF